MHKNIRHVLMINNRKSGSYSNTEQCHNTLTRTYHAPDRDATKNGQQRVAAEVGTPGGVVYQTRGVANNCGRQKKRESNKTSNNDHPPLVNNVLKLKLYTAA